MQLNYSSDICLSCMGLNWKSIRNMQLRKQRYNNETINNYDIID